MALSVAAAGVGGALAYRYYAHADKDYPEPIAAAAPPLYRALFNKWFVDEAYDYLFTGRRKIGNIRLGAHGSRRSLRMGGHQPDRWQPSTALDGGTRAAGTLVQLVGQMDY